MQSIYEDGVMGDLPFTPSGSFSESPSLLKDEAGTLNVEIAQLWADVQGSKLDKARKLAVKSFVDEWKNFYDKHLTFVDRTMFARGVVRRLVNFRKQTDKLRDELKTKYANKVKITPPAPREIEPFKPQGFNVKKALTVAGIGAGAVGAIWLIKKMISKYPVVALATHKSETLPEPAP